ncbi:site-2 protease family protein [Kamptonema cortianum]|uniref:Site-2 protease family protein n=1 Tax=Geitlerinema calcuttense NRMC-F 0142 TaxID=2922238 RepID=A0ABT7M166_9CYAN|nr:site-2 protease family protein [Geitlerinema calcuttense]MDK3156531.1 site-2 protease family protein [Kamptonema cortianum]MDL5057375.1 site-2 protease family protein [Geitlerinema calcuttense NRMC-F 0142]
MLNTSEISLTVVIVLAALAILGWGFWRARPFGKLGILAWLQSVVLMTPWLLFFGLFSLGIYINLAGILFLLLASAGLYIYLGRQLRAAGQDAALRERIAAKLQEMEAENSTPAAPVPDKPNPTATPEAVSAMPAEDIKAIQGIFGIDTFFATETIPYQDGAIFKGNLRGEPEAVHASLSASMQQRVGDRYRLFLLNSPEERPTVVVLPSHNEPQPMTVPQRVLALVLALATIATSLETGGLLLRFDIFNEPTRYPEALPVAVGIWAILIAHELGHFLWAKRHNIRLSWPFFLPTWQIGSFGALTRFESLLPNRQVLFDISLAGPAAGGILSLAMLLLGLLLSHPGSYFQVPSQFFQGSILVGTLAKVVLGDAVQQPLVDVHPLTIIGWLGLVITALNLMPAGQLDGGRIVQAIYGRKIAGRTTVATIIVLAIASLANPLALYWAILILFLQRDLERPSLNELTEPDDARAALGLLALFLMVVTLIPLTPSVAGRLGIG